jgi:putative SOS response-associated peptidase YedK
MFKKFVLASSVDIIEARFHVSLGNNILPIPQNYAVASGQVTYVMTSQQPKSLQLMSFGMTPSFSKKQMNIINARAEGDKNQNNDPDYNGSKSIFMKQAFMKPIQLQRCLVIADAYYDWSDQHKPYLVFLQHKNRPFAFAGLYDLWKNPETGEILNSFAIITTTTNSMLQSIGIKRMPVIFPHIYAASWLKSTKHLADVLRMLEPMSTEMMNAYAVLDLVNNPDVNESSMVNPIGEKLQAEFQSTNIARHRYDHKEKTEPTTPWHLSRINEK